MPKFVFVFVFAVFVLSGCAAVTTPSTYSNYNTPNGNYVTARGRAAENAASANTSHNCPSCIRTTQTTNSRVHNVSNQQPNTETKFVEAIKNDFYNNLRTLFNSKTTEILYER